MIKAPMLLADWARDAARVRRGPLPGHLKSAAIRTLGMLHLRSVGRRDDGPADCGIVGFRVGAFSLSTLTLLFREIFVELDYYFETGRPAPFILDCGSNIGISILFFKALYPQSTIIGFEPARETFGLLSRNVERNALSGVTLHQRAVGNSDDPITFFETSVAGSPTASTNVHRDSNRQVTVEQARLSQFIDREVDFFKLDVEGAEWAVLDDLIATGRLRHIVQMVIEYHHHIDTAVDRFSAFLEQLERHDFGYQIRAVPYGPRQPREFQDLLIYAYRKDRGN
jgi:FkbM family methyltransferase